MSASGATLRIRALCLLGAAALACGGGLAPDALFDPASADLKSTNGLSTNGLSTNGLSTNGLSTNGLSTNGLSTNGFSTWFNSNPADYSAMVMEYVVRCAVAAGQTRTYTWVGLDSTTTPITYTWAGNLGLAPVWASGQPIPLVEQQLVSACLAAHGNKFGVEVPISVRGFQSDGATQIPYTSGENIAYSVKEGCFFGNLFNGDGIYSAYTNSTLTTGANSSYRACAWSNGGLGQCANLLATGSQCNGLCTQLSGSANTGIWNSCTWGGKSYRPITVRILPTSVNTCGDGICQPTESCYDRSTGYGCQTDCGRCP